MQQSKTEVIWNSDSTAGIIGSQEKSVSLQAVTVKIIKIRKMIIIRNLLYSLIGGNYGFEYRISKKWLFSAYKHKI